MYTNEYNKNKSIYIQTIGYYKLQYNRKEEQSNGDNVNQIDFQTEKYRQSTFSMQITLFRNLRQYRNPFNIGIKNRTKKLKTHQPNNVNSYATLKQLKNSLHYHYHYDSKFDL